MSTVTNVSAPVSATLNNAPSGASARVRHEGEEPTAREGTGVKRLSLFGSSFEIGELTGVSFSSLLGC